MKQVDEGLEEAKRRGSKIGPGQYVLHEALYVDAGEFAEEIGIRDQPNWKQIVSRAFEKNNPDVPRTEVYE